MSLTGPPRGSAQTRAVPPCARLIPGSAERMLRLSPTPVSELRVPVTAKLSKRFYDVLGEVIANELVDWFNAVDLTYRGDLRELNELNFARFDARLEQRLAELRTEFRTGLSSRMNDGDCRRIVHPSGPLVNPRTFQIRLTGWRQSLYTRPPLTIG
jgi:hypothetical protein